MSRLLTLNEWITKATAKHGSRYDYTDSDYKNSRSKISIICRKHGVFKQTANQHLKGSGCPKCAKSYTQNQYIKQVKSIHSNKYDYSKTKYLGSHDYISVTCKKHGEIKIKAYTHLQGGGCRRCGIESGAKKQSLTLSDFIKKARTVHGDKYLYNRARYINTSTKIEIECPEHGVFLQTPNMHLRGNGCVCCYLNNSGHSLEGFIKMSKAVHEGRYRYDKVIYNGSDKKVEIVCKKHGAFWQRASGHLRGYGCYKCSFSQGEKEVSRVLKKLGWVSVSQKQIFRKGIHQPMKIDLFIPASNTAIKYHGRQHYQPIGYFGGEKRFKYRQRLDREKREICKKRGIRLIEIPYTRFNEIESILIQELGTARGVDFTIDKFPQGAQLQIF